MKTESDFLSGFVNSSAPGVRQFLSISYSLPPTGARRWLPPSKIVDWGECAGSITVEYLNLGHTEDPIVSGSIMESGTALFEPKGNRLSSDVTHSNFTAVAKAFNCSCVPAAFQVNCLRDPKAAEQSAFTPVADERIVFENYVQHYERPSSSLVPAIIERFW